MLGPTNPRQIDTHHSGEADRPRARILGQGDDVGRRQVLSVGEQVEVLVDLACDPNVLMRQWVGLAVWL